MIRLSPLFMAPTCAVSGGIGREVDDNPADPQDDRGIEGKGQEPGHPALVGFRRVAGDRQRVVTKVATVAISEFQGLWIVDVSATPAPPGKLP
jgi:hypothetical protein